MKNYLSGESFVDNIYQNLINNIEVKNAIFREKTKISSREDAIKAYMNRLEKAHSTERRLNLLKTLYYKRYVINHLPESYIQLQRKIAREQGHGDIIFTEKVKKEKLKYIQDEQKKSLNLWLTYLNSEDAMFPMWFKYYVFQGMLKLGKYDKEKGKFTKRSKDTILPFIEVNPEILGQMYTLLSKMIEDKELNKEELNTLNNGKSFNRLYTYILKNMINDRKRIDSQDGIWVKYVQGDDYKKLWKSLQGKNTGWCTAGAATCKEQIRLGDFYVFYTKDENEEYRIPRVAIRMKGHDEIGEVRGIWKEQNIELEMVKVVDKKLDEFQDKEKYIKKVHDMKLMTIIERKTNSNEDLTKEEIRHLYEIGTTIEGFGMEKDPRIEEIKAKRNVKKDLSYLFDCKEENIGTELSDFGKNEIFAYIGNISLQGTTVPDIFKSLNVILGDADFRYLISSQGLENLQSIGGTANFDNLTSSQGLKNLKTIGGDADFSSLTSSQGLDNLQSIGGTANFDNLTSSQSLKKLKTVGGDASFYKLTSSQGLESLQSIGWSAYFNNLTNSQSLKNLQSIGLNAIFNKLTSSQGLENLQSIDGYADFSSLTSSRGLVSLENIGRDAYFNNLTSSQGLENLQRIGGYADFRNLTNSQGLENLQTIGWVANFRNLTSSQGLEKLQSIGKDANFRSLTSSQGLVSLQSIGGTADFSCLKSSQGLENLQRIGRDADFRNLTSSQGLESLQSIGRNAQFKSLTNSQGLKRLKTIGGYVYFNSLIDARSIKHIKAGHEIILPKNRLPFRKK
ncbi:MAG: hypothetical protein IKF01_00670 [Bacilli bacterium]|nr:hypothetical protein [Bacilli bacterium]